MFSNFLGANVVKWHLCKFSRCICANAHVEIVQMLTLHLCKCSRSICANANDEFVQILRFHLCKCSSCICAHVQVAFVQMFSSCICANSHVAFMQMLSQHLCKYSHCICANYHLAFVQMFSRCICANAFNIKYFKWFFAISFHSNCQIKAFLIVVTLCRGCTKGLFCTVLVRLTWYNGWRSVLKLSTIHWKR